MQSHDNDDYKKPMNKRRTIACLAEATGLSKEQVGGLFDALLGLARQHLNEGRGEFIIPGLLKMIVLHRPSTAHRKGIQSITRRQNVFDAEPARNVIKMVPSKGLKESVK